MYDRVLFPTDGSKGADAALEHVLEIAGEHGATLHLLNVADTTHESVTRVEGTVIDTLEREGETIVENARSRAQARGIATVTDVIQGGVPETIAEYAMKHDVDLIAMPTQGRTGLERALLGSVTEKVIRLAEVPVLTLRPNDQPVAHPPRNVLVPTDGSDSVRVALEHAVEVATAMGATLHVLSVVDVGDLGESVHSDVETDPFEEQAQQAVQDAASLARQAGIESVVEATEAGSSVHRVIQTYVADNDVDLVVMGTHGRTGIERYLIGSVSEKTVRTASVPVLTVPTPELEE